MHDRWEHALFLWLTPKSISIRKEYAQAIVSAPIVQSAARFVNVRISRPTVDMEPAHTDILKYAPMNAMHKLAMDRSAQTDSAMFFLAPVGAYADGTFSNARTHLQAGNAWS